MSTSSIVTQRPVAGAVAHAVWSAMMRSWVAYMTWRIEQLAIRRLREMSDRQLKDIGIVRSQIDLAVKGDIRRDRIVSRCF